MRKILVSVAFMFLACFYASANDADLFNLDYDAVQAEFSDLNQLGNMVTANADLTYTDLQSINENFVANLKLVPDLAIPYGTNGEPVLGIPSFLWGCAFGVIGIVVVYVGADKDPAQTKKAVWGCVTSTVVWTVAYVVIYATAYSSI